MANKHTSSRKSTPHMAADDVMHEQAHHAIDEALAEGTGSDDSERLPSSPGEGPQRLTIETVQLALAEAQKRTLQVQAELENFRKRIRREHTEQLRYATLPLVKDLLPALDNFERAMESCAIRSLRFHRDGGDFHGAKDVV